jgi:hypothetical protein
VTTAQRHPSGAYRYLPAIAAYSSGVAAEPGHQIVGLRFTQATPVAEAFRRLDDHLAGRGLTPAAIVAAELRSPAVVGLGAFDAFNDIYCGLLAERDLMIDGQSPIARTNVVPAVSGPAEPSIHTAFLVEPAEGAPGGDFAIAGRGEVEGPLAPENIVARGDLSADGLARKVDSVVTELCARMAALGVSPDEVNATNVYTVYDVPGLAQTLAERLPGTAGAGYVRWLTRPPVTDIDFEMDCRRVSRWEFL